MRFRLSLHTAAPTLLFFNYSYPLSSALYKIIQRASVAVAAFLHGTGYGKGGKSLALVAFSDVRTPFVRRGGRIPLAERMDGGKSFGWVKGFESEAAREVRKG